jgi:hypothetical protein
MLGLPHRFKGFEIQKKCAMRAEHVSKTSAVILEKEGGNSVDLGSAVSLMASLRR